MNKVVKEQWISALCDPSTKQGFYGMCRATANGNVFCAVGVLANLYAVEYNKPWEKSSIDDYMSLYGCVSYLPDEVVDWAEIDHGTVRDVAYLNDESYTFDYIAKWINEHIEGVE